MGFEVKPKHSAEQNFSTVTTETFLDLIFSPTNNIFLQFTIITAIL